MLRIERTCNLIIKISNSRLINNNKKKIIGRRRRFLPK